MSLVECVPNFSEGRRPDVIAAIREAIAAVPGVAVLHCAADASHNRTVVTFVAPPDAIVDGAFAGIRAARDLIDLRHHDGVHPRIGAADVVPFVPLDGSTMERCVVLARALGERVGRELEIPVFLYERAASRPERRNLADVRRGGFEALREAIGRDAARQPDFGPARVHPTFGAVAIGARPILIAYNVYLGPERHVEIAKRVAREVRESSGGRPGLKALGLVVDGQAQVSMNLVDIDRTSLLDAWNAVRTAAAAHGAEPTWSEIAGMVPERALFDAAAVHLRLRDFSPAQVLEPRIREVVGSSAGGASFLADLASPSPTPGGGSAAAHVGSVVAALARMVAGITTTKPVHALRAPRMREIVARAEQLGATLSTLVVRDAEAYGAVATAFRLPHASDAEIADRRRAIDAALVRAAEIPLETARACADASELAAELAQHGHRAAAADAAVGAMLAEAACSGAALDVRINVHATSDPAAHAALVAEARALAARAAAAREVAVAAVEPS